MRQEEHRLRHEELHRALDELLGDFLTQNPTRRPSETTVMELLEWSHKQTLRPTEKR